MLHSAPCVHWFNTATTCTYFYSFHIAQALYNANSQHSLHLLQKGFSTRAGNASLRRAMKAPNGTKFAKSYPVPGKSNRVKTTHLPFHLPQAHCCIFVISLH